MPPSSSSSGGKVQWIESAAAFAAALEPYKRVGGVLIREDCCSVAVSNAYLSLCDGAGGILLRSARGDGGGGGGAGGAGAAAAQLRVPGRALRRLIERAAPLDEICGWVIGAHAGPGEGRGGEGRGGQT